MNEGTFVAFAGVRKVACGSLGDVLPVLKQRFDRDGSELVLVFDVDTGNQVEFDLRGSLDAIMALVAPARPRGPGRPRLGVSSREVSLLPRHWDWLEQQPSGISAAIRRLVEQASKAQPGRERARRIRAALSKVLSALAGNRPNFEEACRALFAGDAARVATLIQRWPKDIREYVLQQATEAARADADAAPASTAGSSVSLVEALHRRVWSEGDYSAIERLVAPRYVIHSDPGDPWDKKTLDRKTYEERVRYSRGAFPDLAFTLEDTVAAGDRVAVRWCARGTHDGDLHGLPATGKRLRFSGQTSYIISDGRVAGHWQVVDRLGFIEQLR